MIIWKCPIHTGFTEYQLPANAKILDAQEQEERPCIWVLFDPDVPRVRRVFFCTTTGEPIFEEYSANSSPPGSRLMQISVRQTGRDAQIGGSGVNRQLDAGRPRGDGVADLPRTPCELTHSCEGHYSWSTPRP